MVVVMVVVVVVVVVVVDNDAIGRYLWTAFEALSLTDTGLLHVFVFDDWFY